MSTGKSIIDTAVLTLSDDGNVRWPLAELVGWLNEAIKQIILAKPSASTSSVEISLAAGTRQDVPSSGTPKPLRLIGFERNVTTAGNAGSQGRVITSVSKQLLDAEQPNWHNSQYVPFKTEVRNGIFDEDDPTQFYVYPGNDGNGIIACQMSVLPEAQTVANYDTQETGLSDIYDPAMVDYVLARAFLKDDLNSNPSRSTYHSQLFGAAIGVKIRIEGATSPNKDRTQPT